VPIRLSRMCGLDEAEFEALGRGLLPPGTSNCCLPSPDLAEALEESDVVVGERDGAVLVVHEKSIGAGRSANESERAVRPTSSLLAASAPAPSPAAAGGVRALASLEAAPPTAGAAAVGIATTAIEAIRARLSVG
jgi:hypothetical protein